MKALICPVMLHDKTVFYATPAVSRAEKTVSISIAVFIHLAVFAAAGACLIKPAQAGVDRGLSSIEVNLVAAPTEVVPPAPKPVPLVPVQAKSDFTEKRVIKPVKVVDKQAPSKTIGHDHITAKSSGGAITEAKPDYLNNPAPEYPDEARRKGWEGTVILKVVVSASGYPEYVGIDHGCGHATLDEAALKAVRKWRFRPAQLGNMPVESTVRVPVKFILDQA